ncbi:MAG: M14 family zinc carboxypeptidase [Candidatus Krumholzibacteriia bacterium]
MRMTTTHGFAAMLLIATGAVGTDVAIASSASIDAGESSASRAEGPAIPVDANGLPRWQVRQWNDVPVRIELPDQAALDALLQQVPIASFHREQIQLVRREPKGYRVVFTPRVTELERAALEAAGYAPQPLPDLERAMREETERLWAAEAAGEVDLPVKGDIFYYPTHTQIGAILAAAAADHPTLVRTYTWGTSVEGRELWGAVISDHVDQHEAEPEIRLSSSMHGDEPVGMVMLLNLVEYLTDNHGQPGFEDVTALVDDHEIHVLPLHNPDGYVAHSRYNANGRDLNRNFPVPDGSIGDDGTWTEEVETIALKDHGLAHHFVVSQNGHGGAIVVNYPWDHTYALTPDDAAIVRLALEYSQYNLPMYTGPFDQGITNGAQWYVVEGSLQDWSYHETGCIDLTVELYGSKWPDASLLEDLWNDNRESLVHFIAAARYGVNGVVTAADSGLPLAATVTVVGIDQPVSTDPAHGDYYKLLDTGTYDVVFSAEGHVTHTEYGVTTAWGTPTVLDVALQPAAHGDVSGVVADLRGNGLAAAVEVRTHPMGDLVATIDTGPGGGYSASLVHGEYELTARSDGYAPASQVVAIGAASVVADFALAAMVVAYPIVSDFDADTGVWSGDWGLASPPDGYDGGNSLTDSPGGNYPSGADLATVCATAVDLGEAIGAEVSFQARWSIESSWDAAFFQISTDGGVTWDNVATEFTRAGSGQGVQQPAGTPLFDGSQSNWLLNTVDLASYLGQPDVRFRFLLRSDGSVQRDGMYVDDFTVSVATLDDTTGVDDTPARRPALAAFPNPFNPGTTLRFDNPRAGPVELAIHDALGRRIRTLLSEHRPAGEQTAHWDGRGDDGLPAASGVYLARLRAGGGDRALKLTLVK